MTLAEMRTTVGNLINQSVTDDTKTVTKTFVDTALNLGYHKVVNSVNALNGDFYLQIAKGDIVADNDLYTFPSDFKILRRIDILSDGEYVEVDRINPNTLADIDLDVTYTDPAYYLVKGGFRILPTPDEDITNGFRIHYIRNVSDLTDDTDEPDLPLGYEDLPIYFATSMAHNILGNTTLAQSYMAQFNGEVQAMTHERIGRSQDATDYVILKDTYTDDVVY